MNLLLCFVVAASYCGVTALQCHAQYQIDIIALAAAMKESNYTSIPRQILSTQDVVLTCTGKDDSCVNAHVGDFVSMKSCTSSCEEVKASLPPQFEVDCCKKDMCNTGNLGNGAIKKVEKEVLESLYLVN